MQRRGWSSALQLTEFAGCQDRGHDSDHALAAFVHDPNIIPPSPCIRHEEMLLLAMRIEFRANPNAQSQISRAIIEAVQKIKCPKHGTGAAVVSETPLKFQYCCQELEAKIKAEAR